MIRNHTNDMLAILQVMSSVLETKHYDIQFLVISVSALLKFFEFITKVRNEMSLIIAILLIEHFISFTVRKVDLHASFKLSVEMHKNKRIRKSTFELIKCFLCFDESNEFDFNNFLFCFFR